MDILVSTLVSTDKNKEILIKFTELWDKIKNLIKKITNKSGKTEKVSPKSNSILMVNYPIYITFK